MSFLEKMQTEANYTRTLNGAKTHGSTGEACLDFFAVAGGMRYRKRCDQVRLFERAYIETPDLAMKLLFHIRDIRGGMGERAMFRTLLRHVAQKWPDSARKNVEYVAEFGRWDDLLCLIGTPAQHSAVQVIKAQLDQDIAALERREAGDQAAHISLLAKWLPSDNASSQRTRANAKRLIKALDMTQRDYRRTLTALRARIGLTERQLTRGRTDKVNYEAVPAQAMFKYRAAFERNDRERYADYLADVGEGKKGMHADTLFPYEVLRPYFNAMDNPGYTGADTLEQLWRKLPGGVGNSNGISVVDTSGSMYCVWHKGDPMPALMSQAMGLYCAERCTGAFHNVLITFESTPHLVKIHGKTLRDKLDYLQTLDWGGSTDLEAVFELILRTAIKHKVPQQELPQVIYIFSDMEFNECMYNADETVYENASRKFRVAGYQMPAVVFHNVNSWQMQTPVSAHTRGAALTSGAGTSALQHKFDGNITPMQHMLRVLCGKRYEMISA